MIKRRHFLKQTSFLPAALFFSDFYTYSTLYNNRSKKILVVIQLSGGNDGLNTIIPYRNDLYYQNRPTLSIVAKEALKLTDELAFNSAFESLRSIFDLGEMSIINNVGYPDSSRSHFRAMDIWHTASSSQGYLSTGWLGRFLDQNGQYPHEAIEINENLSLALKGAKQKGILVNKNNQFRRDFLNKTEQEKYKKIAEQSKAIASGAIYPQHKFGQDLKKVAALISSDADTRIYYVNLGCFDTHINQQNTQNRLLRIYAKGVSAFIKDLKKHNLFDDVMLFTFSEFGRSVKENKKGGTNHGTANNVFLFNGNLQKSGFYNASPDLLNLDRGGLKYEIDFRSIYATLLEDWLNEKSSIVLGQSFDKLNLVQ